MAENKKIDLDDPKLFTANSEAIEEALKAATKAALLMHKRLKNPVAVSWDGMVVLIQPEDIYPGED